MEQIISVIGAALILGAFAGAQFGRIKPEQPSYGLMNLVGSALLTYIAVLDQRIGFIILEGAWAAISAYSLIRYWSKK